ncbi:hypothetical protein B296_00005778 [Ensete ventricosum]|uniref:Uncharacterized protein n=1 Tax=Ensete ventricosum TaxID=4639 RepID=A0A427APK3_ENSVE|nr:hypothetical protein B296_00005778 [Ensete ventricosum]
MLSPCACQSPSTVSSCAVEEDDNKSTCPFSNNSVMPKQRRAVWDTNERWFCSHMLQLFAWTRSSAALRHPPRCFVRRGGTRGLLPALCSPLRTHLPLPRIPFSLSRSNLRRASVSTQQTSCRSIRSPTRPPSDARYRVSCVAAYCRETGAANKNHDRATDAPASTS